MIYLRGCEQKATLLLVDNKTRFSNINKPLETMGLHGLVFQRPPRKILGVA